MDDEVRSAPARPDPMRFCPEELKQRFAVSRVLGTGGMGAVFEGAMPGTGKPCALKVIFGDPGKSAAARLVQEAKLMGRLRHPHLIEVYDTGSVNGGPWLAMELVDGGDLKQRARARGDTLPADEVEQMLRDVASVFTALHAQGILHRDIKPQNLMRTREGRTVVMDLGLARDVDATRHTATGALVGTLLYMAPEMLIHDSQGPALDWYALGVTAYVLLTGDKPYEQDQVMTMIARGIWQAPKPMAPSLRRQPAARLALAMMDPDPGRRITDEAAALALLEATESGAYPRSFSSTAVPVGRPAGLPSVPRGRGPWLAALGAVGLLLGFGVAHFGAAPRAPTPPAATAPAPTGPEVVVVPTRDPLLEICRRLGYPDPGDVAMAMEALTRSPDLGKIDEAARLLEAEPASSRTRYFLLRVHEAKGAHDSLERLVRGLDYRQPLQDYWDVRLLAEALGYRLVYDGGYAEGAVPARQARLREDLAGFEQRLARREELFARVGRMEFWNVLGRRAQVRPRLNVIAMEEADRQATELLHRVGEMEPFLAAAFVVAAGRGMARMAEFQRYHALYELHGADLLAPLRSPELAEFWRHEMTWDGREENIPGGVLSPQRFFAPSMDTAWLPARPDLPGTGSLLAAHSAPLLPDRPPRPEMVLEGADGVDAEAFGRVAAQAALAKRPLRVDPEWLDRHLPVTRLRQDPAMQEAILGVPEVLLALAPRLESAGDHERALSLLREADRRRRTAKGFLSERSAWYHGDWAELTRTLVELEFRVGDLGRAMDLARTQLQNFARRNPPWPIGEVEEAWRLWRAVALQLNRNGTCPGFPGEVLRMGLHLLEGLDRQRPALAAGVVARHRWRQRMVSLLDGWLWEWGVDRGTDFQDFEALVREFEDSLNRPEPDPDGVAQKLYVKVKAERLRRGLAGKDVCPDGYARELAILPEVVFRAGGPGASGGPDAVARLRALLARL